MSSSPPAPHEDLARWIWTLVIVSFFAVQAVIWCVAITLTASDPSFAVAPRYEQIGENWDAVVAEREASRLLGWHLEFHVVGDAPNATVFHARLTDPSGEPISDAHLELSLFHCARAAEVVEPQVVALGDGWYATDAQATRSGFWKFRGVVRRGTTAFHFDQKQRMDLPGGRR